jgi:hypothetical protein
MTYISTDKFEASPTKVAAKKRARFRVQETHWGYVVATTDKPRLSLQVTQLMAMLSGGTFAAASLSLLLLPDFLSDGAAFPLRAGAAVIFAALAAYLLWYSSRGSQVEYQVDTNQGEVREIVRNRAGRPSLMGVYGFDCIGGVYIERANQSTGNAALCLRYQNTSQKVPVAFGYAADLEALKDRLGQDLMIGGKAVR